MLPYLWIPDVIISQLVQHSTQIQISYLISCPTQFVPHSSPHKVRTSQLSPHTVRNSQLAPQSSYFIAHPTLVIHKSSVAKSLNSWCNNFPTRPKFDTNSSRQSLVSTRRVSKHSTGNIKKIANVFIWKIMIRVATNSRKMSSAWTHCTEAQNELRILECREHDSWTLLHFTARFSVFPNAIRQRL